jgi:hypothetical protein
MKISGSKTCLDVAYGDPPLEGSHRPGHGTGCVSLHKEKVWLLLLKHRIQASENPRSEHVEGLPWTHHLKIVVHFQAETFQKRQRKIGVLGGADIQRRQIVTPSQLLDNWSKFDNLRAGSKHAGYAEAFRDWRGGLGVGVSGLHMENFS